MSVVLLSREAKIKIILPVSSPAAKDGNIGLDRLVRRAIKSVAACLRKSVMVTSGKFNSLGRKTTVSASTFQLLSCVG